MDRTQLRSMRLERQNKYFPYGPRSRLKSRVWIDVRSTENDSSRLYKNGDISAVIKCG